MGRLTLLLRKLTASISRDVDDPDIERLASEIYGAMLIAPKKIEWTHYFENPANYSFEMVEKLILGFI